MRFVVGRGDPGVSPGGVLVVAGAPIGDPADASARLRAELARADVVAAEDTRRLRRLARALDVELPTRVVSHFEGNETVRSGELVAALRRGERVLLVTDAGMPAVSDPGFRLVAAAISAGLPVTVVPGPSAVTAALAVSGLPSDRFCFEGFLPRRPGERRARLAALSREPRTLVLFESPRRLAASLVDLAVAFGPDRRAAVCRELTKTHEEVRRAGLGALAAWAADGVLGEVTLVIAGADVAAPSVDPDQLARLVAERERVGVLRRDAIAAVAGTTGQARRVVYDAVVAAKHARGAAPRTCRCHHEDVTEPTPRKPGAEVRSPAKFFRLSQMVGAIRTELGAAGVLDDATRARLRELLNRTLEECATVFSPELLGELQRLEQPLRHSTLSDVELRIAYTQVVGWLQGVVNAIQLEIQQARSGGGQRS